MNLKQMSDQELVILYTGGTEAAFEELLKRHQSKVYTSIYLLVKDHYIAEDIFQETFIKVINTLKAGRYNDEGKFLPWVIRIGHNLVIDHFRREKRSPLVTDSEGNDIFATIAVFDESAEDILLRNQAHNDIRSMIQLLPEEQREVLIMRHYADLSFKEIADVTNVSINTALGRMRYALTNLRKMLLDKDLSIVRVN